MSERNSLPEGWAWTILNEVSVKIQDGTHFSPKAQSQNGTYKYITAKNVRSSGLDLDNVAHVSEADHRTIYKRCDPKKGDVLLVKDGVNTGDAAMNTLEEEFSLLSSVCLIRPREGVVYGPYVRYYLSSPIGYKSLTGQMTGTAIKRIILRRIKEVPIPVAPLREQHRIVEKIEELFTKLDAGVQSLKQTQSLLKSYRHSVLKSAVEGELSREWREAHRDELEPASELLDRILHERREKFTGKKYKEPASPDTSDLPALPYEWEWASIQQVAGTSSGGTPSRKALQLYEGDIPWVKSGELRDNIITGTEEHISDSALENSSAKLFPKNALLIALYGATIGKLGILGIEAATNQAVCAIFLPPQIIVHYVFYVFMHLRRALIEQGKGGAQPNISQGIVRETAIPLPPFAEQTFIVEEIERRLSVVDKLEATVEANLKHADALRQSILKQAFSGELVAQDPDDEPASVLLERIRSARQAAKQKSGKKSLKARQKVSARAQPLELFPEQGA